MTYTNVANVAEAGLSLQRRLTAAAAQEGVPNPEQWAYAHRWDFARQPGWAEAWASALASNPDADPGASEAVITDAMILAAVQALRTADGA